MRSIKKNSCLLNALAHSNHRKTGIVCTVGKNNSAEFLSGLIHNGMNVMRINCSHGDLTHHGKSLENLKEALNKIGNKKVIGTLLDIRGPKIRTGLLSVPELSFDQDTDFLIKLVPTAQLPNFKGTLSEIYCDYMSFPKTVHEGQRVLIDDGLMQVVVKEIGSDFIKVRTLNKAILKERKGVIIPGSKIDLPAVSEKDKKDLQFAVEKNVDYVAASFIQSAEMVRDVRNELGSKGAHIKIISKIENQAGLDNIDEIIQESDGIMVARGDLGTELPPELMFKAQKRLIDRCNILGTPVITATQMLESMTNSPHPTNAECTDIANAILDGTDCVMLSGETASGKYPNLAVKTMNDICLEVEKELDYESIFNYFWDNTGRPFRKQELVAASCVRLAYETQAKLIVVLSETGETARFVSKYRPFMPIVALTYHEFVGRSLGVMRGVIPHILDRKFSYKTLEEVIKSTFEHFTKNGFIKSNSTGKNHVVCIYDTNFQNNVEDSNNIRLYRF